MRTVWLNFRLFLQGALLSYVALFRWLSPMTYLASKVAGPVFQILFFTLLGTYATGQQNASFYVIGNAVLMTAVSGIYGVTMSIGGDRWEGTLPYLFGTPANRMVMFIGRAFFHVIDGALGVVLGLMWGVILLGLDLSHTDPLALTLTILITTISTSGLGLMMGCISLVTQNVFFINNTVYFSLLIFSGANVPLESLPSIMRAISQGLPLTRGIAAARAIIGGSSLAEIAPLLAGELLIGAVYITFGYVMFRRFEFQAKRKGTLEVM